MKLKPDAILFDMDGVLIDSLDAWWEALNASLKIFGISGINKEEFIRKYWGHDLYDNLRKMNLDLEIGLECSRIYAQYADKIKIFPETKGVLEKLKGYKKGLITNTPKNCTYKILEKFSIQKYFDTVVTTDDVEKGKPDPEIVLKACKDLNVDPSKVVLVGDTLSDIKAGREAGCTVVGVKVDGDFTIKDISELTKIIDI